MSMICPKCERTYQELKTAGKLRVVQGYQQCGHCGGDLEDESVVWRTKKWELQHYECQVCGHKFGWVLDFIGIGSEECPSCHSAYPCEIPFESAHPMLLRCNGCKKLSCVQTVLRNGSIWALRQECPCGGDFVPSQVGDDEVLLVYDEEDA